MSGVGEFKEKVRHSPQKAPKPQSHYRGESFGNCLLLNSGSKDFIENPRGDSNVLIDPKSLQTSSMLSNQEASKFDSIAEYNINHKLEKK